ncbi:homocysteine S-methyltransferase family protein [bacterium]|nr:homocysteine S-methyltransferase family protein [candidate division CSSED10-310 bacterium]
MMQPFIERLNKNVVLFDGAMGTQLINKGMKHNDCAERWVLDHRETILNIHRDYVRAGAEVLTTDTFCGTKFHLEKHGLAARLDDISREAVRCAREAAEDKAFVAGDVGPSGLMYPPMGNATDALLEDLFAEQIESLLKESPDIILIETQYDLREALSALRSARKLTTLPIGVTMTYNHTKRGFYTLVGNSVSQCCQAIAAEGADFMGANCTLTPEDMLELAPLLASSAELPVLIQPNAGQPVLGSDGVTYKTTAEAFAKSAARLLVKGVGAIGGCCGTSPLFIKYLRDLLDMRTTL